MTDSELLDRAVAFDAGTPDGARVTVEQRDQTGRKARLIFTRHAIERCEERGIDLEAARYWIPRASKYRNPQPDLDHYAIRLVDMRTIFVHPELTDYFGDLAVIAHDRVVVSVYRDQALDELERGIRKGLYGFYRDWTVYQRTYRRWYDELWPRDQRPSGTFRRFRQPI